MAEQLQPVTSRNLPTPVGPYSPGMIVGNLIFVSGQAGRDPATGTVAPDVTAQTEQVLKNVSTILEPAASRIVLTFFRTCSVCAVTSGATVPVAGSRPAWPDTKMRLPTIIPGEYGPTGVGRFLLVTGCNCSAMPSS